MMCIRAQVLDFVRNWRRLCMCFVSQITGNRI